MQIFKEYFASVGQAILRSTHISADRRYYKYNILSSVGDDIPDKMIPSSPVKSNQSQEYIPDICIERKALTINEKHKQFSYEAPQQKGLCEKASKSLASSFSCSTRRLKKILLARLPILKWLPKYRPKQDLMGDFIAGITVAVMHIPQGMAYAMLAGLAPINGIYMAFFPVLVYAIFGTSRHCSIGTFAVVCIMTGKVVNELSIPENPDERATFLADAAANNITVYTNVEVATIVSFSVGIWLLVFAVLQLGTLSVFFSDMLVSGFTTGASIHVLTSQVKHLFGLQIPSFNGPLKIINTYRSIIGTLQSSNWATVTISVICLVLLIVNNEVLKPRMQKITRIPLPIELILVILGTLVSFYRQFHTTFQVIIVGDIPTGLPSPKLPPFALFGTVMVDSLIIAIVSYTISFAMAKILAKDQYTVNPTQELCAQSFADLVGSFFSCAPISVSLSRSLIQTSVGGATQITSVISCSLLLLVLLFLGPYFETLPNCVLAAIILVALKGMLMQFKDFFNMLKMSYLDAFVWIITFLAVVVIDIDYGLFIGIIVSCLVLIIRNQSPLVHLLGRVPGTELYLNTERYGMAAEMSDFKICQISGNLHFANQLLLKKEIVQKTDLDPKKIVKILQKEIVSVKTSDAHHHLNGNMKHASSSYSQDVFENGKVITPTDDSFESQTKLRTPRKSISIVKGDKAAMIHQANKRVSVTKTTVISLPSPAVARFLILDFSGVGRMDISACKNLVNIHKEYKDANITVAFSGLSEEHLRIMTSCDALQNIPENLLFHSIHDAVSFLSCPQVLVETVHL